MPEAIRRGAIAGVEAGESQEAVAAGLGINRRTIYRWLISYRWSGSYRHGGEDAIGAKPIPGAPRKLDDKQLAKLAQLIREQTPSQLKFEFARWTPAIIRELIRREFGVHLSEVSVVRLMKLLGFSAHRPLYRAWRQDGALLERWRAQDYPQVAARAKREKALTFFADESGVRSDRHAGMTWAPVGQMPVVNAPAPVMASI